MIIVQISDSHIDPEHPNGPARVRDLERCVAAINALDPAPDVIIHTGDLTHNGTPPKYDVALGVLRELKPPLLLCAGNRDDRALVRRHFPDGRDLMPGTAYVHYSVDDFPVRLIALDTISAASNMGDFCDERAEGLRRALAEDTEKPTAIFMHHPPFEVVESKYRWQFDSRDAIAKLADVLEGQDHVIRTFSGHAHRDASGMVAGVPASTAPSVAIDLRLGEFPNADGTTPVFQRHTYDGRRSFVTETRAAA